MRVLGIDTGRWVGWALLDVHRGSATYLQAGVLDAQELGEDTVVHSLTRIGEHCALVGIERVVKVLARRGMFDSTRATDLVTTAWLGGRIFDSLDRLTRVKRCTADEVRAQYLAPVGPRESAKRKAAGEKHDVDGAVLEVCRREIWGWPALIPGSGRAYRKDGGDLLAQHRCHAADAALVGLFASREAA